MLLAAATGLTPTVNPLGAPSQFDRSNAGQQCWHGWQWISQDHDGSPCALWLAASLLQHPKPSTRNSLTFTTNIVPTPVLVLVLSTTS